MDGLQCYFLILCVGLCWRWAATIPYYFSNLHGGAEILVHVATCFVLIPTQEKLMLHLLRLTNINIIFPSETAHSNRGWRWVATLWYSSICRILTPMKCFN